MSVHDQSLEAHKAIRKALSAKSSREDMPSETLLSLTARHMIAMAVFRGQVPMVRVVEPR